MRQTERVVILLTKSEKATLSQRAATMHMSVCEYVREIIWFGNPLELGLTREMSLAAERAIQSANRSLDVALANMAVRAARRTESNSADGRDTPRR